MFTGRHVDSSMHVECHLLAVRRPGLVAKAVDILSIPFGGKRELVGGNRILAVNLMAGGILNLYSINELACMSTAAVYLDFSHIRSFWPVCLSIWRPRYQRTQKLMSRFPLPPNSVSPVWKTTLILSSTWRFSKKHSLECALSGMLCAVAAPMQSRADTAREEKASFMAAQGGRTTDN